MECEFRGTQLQFMFYTPRQNPINDEYVTIHALNLSSLSNSNKYNIY